MWFGTFDGLNRYDGYNFRIFRNKMNDSASLINSFINALTEDKKGRLWIGTRHGLSIYNNLTDKFTHLSYRVNNSISIVSDVIKSIGTDKLNNVFVGTENMGLLFYKNDATVAQPVALNIEGIPVTSFGVQIIKIAPENKVWVFVQNRGLCLLDYASMTLRLVNSTVRSVSSLEVDATNLWIGTSQGLYQYNTVSNECSKVQYGNSGTDRIASLNMDKDHNLWIGTLGNGVVIWSLLTGKTESLQAGDSRYSLSSADAYTIYDDKESRKWIGTQKGGINIIDPQKKKFQTIAHDPGIAEGFKGNTVSAFYEAPDSSLWVGTDGTGFNIWNRKKNSFTNLHYRAGDDRSLPSNYITAIKPDADKNIWIATFTAGLLRLDEHGNSLGRYKCINPVSGLENPVVSVLYTDTRNILWATTLRQGNQYGALYYYNKTADKFDAFDTGLSDLFTLHEDRQGNFWAGNLNQLIKIDRVAKRHRFYPMTHTVRSIFEDRKGNLWIGTEGGGLILFDRTQNKINARYTTEEGLCNNAVLNILEDKSGNLWMSTLNGLSIFDPVKKIFRNYYYNDGLQSNQFNYNAALVLRSGELAFGGIKGFNVFYPDSILPVQRVPQLMLSDIMVNNIPFNRDNSYTITKDGYNIEALSVPYNKAVLSFGFIALEYSSPEKISYAYFLEGWDRGWNYTGNLRTATYTHLNEGTYFFRVKSTNAEGAWNPAEIKLKIVVLPPWYRSWWAFLFYAIMAAAAVYFYLQYLATQTRLKYEVKIARLNAENERSERQRSEAELGKEKAELEKERAEREKEHAEREKERILNEQEREINEKKISYFTNISHEFRTPLTLIINPVKDLLKKNGAEHIKDDGGLNIVYRNARRMLSLIDQLLLFRKAESGLEKIKPSRLNLYELAYEVYLCFVQQAKSQNINYVFDCVNKNSEVYADREKLEIILYNLLSNALKYTPANGSIQVIIDDRAEDVVIKVEDNGAGIPSETGEKLFDKFYKAERTKTSSKAGFGIGLFLVKHFTDQHFGTISYKSEEGQGTLFTLILPKGKDHFGPEVTISETDSFANFSEMLKDEPMLAEENEELEPMTEVISEKKSILIIDDDEAIRQYLVRLFKDSYLILQAENGKTGLEAAQKHLPDLIISDIQMPPLNGIELCKAVKENEQLSHIPVILLTGATSEELKLRGVEGGADDYIVKPFDNTLLIARVANLLKSRNILQKYFYNEITLNNNDFKVSPEYKEFLDKCISIVEGHLRDKNFSVKTLLAEMGMSHSNLFRKVKLVSGQSVNVFIRFIRLRKAAALFINDSYSIKEVAYMVGVNDVKYFREQFNKLFGMNPSDFIKKYRTIHGKQYTIDKETLNPEKDLLP